MTSPSGAAQAGSDPMALASLAEGAETIVLRSAPGAALSGAVRAVRGTGASIELDLATQDAFVLDPALLGSLARVIVTVGRADPRALLASLGPLLDAGLAVIVRLPIDRGLQPVSRRIAWLRRAEPRLRAFRLALRRADAESVREVEEAAGLARTLGVEVALSPESPIPPCLAELGGAHKALLRDRFRQAGEANAACEACAGCALREVCTITAEELARLAPEGRQPRAIADASAYLRPGRSPGSRLHVLGAAEVETFFHVDYEWDAALDDPQKAISRIGILYRCNQKCTFCELADMDVELSREKVGAALEAARARGSNRVILTGGEPTLSPDLVHHVAHARALGFTVIEIQTNAVRLSKPGRAAELRAAGLTHAQISLHGPDAAISDRLTAAPGTHARTLAGVDALLEQGVVCLLNHLVFKDNCQLLERFVELVETRWGRHRERLIVQFHSPRNEFPTREEALRHVPRYADYAQGLRRAIDRARELGIAVNDLQDPTGIPSLCVLGADEAYLGKILAQAETPRFHRWESGWSTRVAACERCDARHACMGAPAHYVALHGDSEFHPIVRSSCSA